MENTANPAYSIINPQYTGAFLFTAEHASPIIPARTNETDQSFLSTHWAYDIGVLPLMKQLCKAHKAQGLYTNYSRLWIDTNRAPQQEGLIKTHIDGAPLSFNQSLTSEEKIERQTSVHEAYHQAISNSIHTHSFSPLLISLHSFTPIWNHHIRTMDIGVLFDRDEDLAHICTALLRTEGFFVEENKPYSGKNGLIYSAHRHGVAHQIPYIELEFNQSILCTPQRITMVAKKLSRALITLQQEHPNVLSR